MSKSSTLRRLKKRRKAAFVRREAAFKDFDEARNLAQATYEAMNSAKAEFESCRMKLKLEYNAMVFAREHTEELWEKYHHIRDVNNPQIRMLRAEADAEHTAMKESYDLAGAAHSIGNKAEAASYILEGQDHQERRNNLNLEISDLTREVKNAKASAIANEKAAKSNFFYQAKLKFDAAKSKYQCACEYFEQCKADRERLWKELLTARTNYDRAKNDLDDYFTDGT